jgi:hypothetical protein
MWGWKMIDDHDEDRIRKPYEHKPFIKYGGAIRSDHLGATLQ